MVRTTQSTKRSFAGPDRANNCVSIYNVSRLTQTCLSQCDRASPCQKSEYPKFQRKTENLCVLLVGWVEFSSSFIVRADGVVH
eukprot:scaffold4958_cov145-Skeletonema_marinoi.AAC.17